MRFESDRRTFLGAGGAAAIAAAAPLAGAGSISPKQFGAAGDGKLNDLDAVNKAISHALDHGLPIDGGDFEYGVSGGVIVSKRTRPFIDRLRLKQLSPASDRVTLAFVDCEEIRIDGLQVHVGNAPGAGNMDTAVGLLVQGGSGHKLRNVTMTGDGNVTYVRFRQCADSVFENIHVHDGRFANSETELVRQDRGPSGTIRVPDDVVQGIHLADCRRCNLVNPIVRNLTGNATYFNAANVIKAFANFRTRGIAGGGNVDCSILNPMVSNVEQAIDFSGGGDGWGNRNVQILGGHSLNCGSVGVKFANAPNGCKAIGHTARNCGMMGFMLTGQNSDLQGIDSSFIDCEAVNPGYNDVHFDTDFEALAHSGFYLLSGSPGGLVGARVSNCRAIDRQGFYLVGDDAPWALAGATKAIMAEAWTGYTGEYPARFTTSNGQEARTINLAAGSTSVTWAAGLDGAVRHPFVSRPPRMQYGALLEGPPSPVGAAENRIDNFQSTGHVIRAQKGFSGRV